MGHLLYYKKIEGGIPPSLILLIAKLNHLNQFLLPAPFAKRLLVDFRLLTTPQAMDSNLLN